MRKLFAKIKRTLKVKMKKCNLVRIAVVFHKSVMKGFIEYQKIKEQYGEETPILTCTSKGTGDYYYMGMYLSAWLEKNKVDDYVVLVGGNAEKRVTELFPGIFDDRCILLDWEHYTYLIHMRVFYGAEATDIRVFHHIAAFGGDYTWNIWITWFLMGYKNLNQLDFYLYHGFQLPRNTTPQLPQFSQEINKIQELFKVNRLKEGKTVLLSPFSTGNGEFPGGFWEPIIKKLVSSGYTVCTNCFGEEKALANTTRLSLGFLDVVPFLNKAGYFIGIRSGLADIISSAKCKKIIVHTYYANHWPNGNSISYTGLNNSGLCTDAIEYQFEECNVGITEMQNRIINDIIPKSNQESVIQLGKSRKRKDIKIRFADVPQDFDQERHWITRTLRKKYNVIFTDNPDFLFYSAFGLSFDQYENCVKIFFTGEDTIPNFNECDYAMGHDILSFGDRYIRADVGERYGSNEIRPDWIKTGLKNSGWINCSLIDLHESIQNRDIVSDELFDREFCNFIYSNEVFGEGAKLRKQFCMELMKYKHVDCPGEVLHNIDNAIQIRWRRENGQNTIEENWVIGKLEFIKKYKFTIAFENIFMDGHTTEKLIHPLYAYSIPIYWGNPSVVKDFNPKAFINCNDYNGDWSAIIEKIIELDNDKEKYLEMLRQPPMRDDFDFGADAKAEAFLYGIIEKGNKPYTKGALTFSGPNQARQVYRELHAQGFSNVPDIVGRMHQSYAELNYIKSTTSWKIMMKMQAFADSKIGWLPKKVFKTIQRLRRRYKEWLDS